MENGKPRIIAIDTGNRIQEILIPGFEEHCDRSPRANHELDLIVLKASIELEIRDQEPTKRSILEWILQRHYAELSVNSSHSVWRSLKRLEESGYVYQGAGSLGIYRPTQVQKQLRGRAVP